MLLIKSKIFSFRVAYFMTEGRYLKLVKGEFIKKENEGGEEKI